MQYKLAAAPLKAELAGVGFPAEEFGSFFFKFRPEHRVFIPILIKWLYRLENNDVKETIVRHLTDRMARPVAAKPLIEEFKRASGPEPSIQYYKATIAGALGVVADDSVFDEIASLASDPCHGWSRGFLYPALQRSRNPRAEEVLLRILKDSAHESIIGVPKLMIRALGNRGSSRAKSDITRFLDHSDSGVRKEAQKSLDKIARAEQKRTLEAEQARAAVKSTRRKMKG